jgi:deazaflavin-dependent oxidoreductase (nitroreductase family)
MGQGGAPRDDRRISGRPVTTAVGFVEHEDGSLLVAAGGDQSDWALNLRVWPSVKVTIGELSATYTATEVDEHDRGSAVRDLILKYGTPAERLGRGPVFRLIPAAESTNRR